MKAKFLDYYMSIAESTAQLSNAVRLKVGSVIVRDHQIIGTGYNGTPSGWDNACEDVLPDGTLKTKNITIHSESNAILKVARSTESSVGATMFCTYAPCIDCAKLIHQAGITKLYYRNHYRSDDGLDFLDRCGVSVEHYPVSVD
jgi:dCMP deaminase